MLLYRVCNLTKLGTCTVYDGYHLGVTAFKGPFDEDFIEALKERVPRENRRWDPDEKLWLIDDKFAGTASRIVAEFFNIEYDDS